LFDKWWSGSQPDRIVGFVARTYVRQSKRPLATLAIGLTLGLALPNLVAADPGPSSPARIHLVSKGETLWGLARRYGGQEDPRSYVHEVLVLNRLEKSLLVPGQRLLLPSR
jgi:hypothetical protein